MRYLILSDIHANWEALQAVLADAAGLYDRILNCGDLVGYGPDPNPVVEFCREHCHATVRGNHDKAVAGIGDLDWFNPLAKQAALWSRAHLTAPNLEYLATLCQGPLEVDRFALVHGSPADEDDYLIDPSEARLAAAGAVTGLSFFGHTHLQGGFYIHRQGSRAIETNVELRIEETATYLVNPGSVGQPRDGDPRAAYAIYDPTIATVFFRRAPYPMSETHRKIIAAGLPPVLGTRLYQGL